MRVREGSRARPQIPVVRSVSSQQPADYIVAEAQGEIVYYCLVIFYLLSCTEFVFLFVSAGPNTQQPQSGASLSAGPNIQQPQSGASLSAGPNTQQPQSGASLVAQIEKIKSFLAAANNTVEKTENRDNEVGGEGGEGGEGVYWADVVLIDHDNEEHLHLQSSRSQVSSRSHQTNKRKSWMQENLDFVQLNYGESEV